MPRMHLPWPVARNGYRIAPAKPARGPAVGTIIGGFAAATDWIVRNGSEVDHRDCLAIDGLYRRLADHEPNQDGALAFANRYGLLSNREREAVQTFTDNIRIVRSLVAAAEAEDWTAIHRWLGENRKAIRFQPDLKLNGRPQFFFRPARLIDAIYAQFLEDVAGGIGTMRLCARPGCGNWFKFGPGTNHRETARYCSPKCQGAHAYAKRKEASI